MRVHRSEDDLLFIDAGGTRFAALAWGDGPLVLLLHGFPDTARTWDRIGPELAHAGYRVVAPFLRGYAPTAIPDVDTTTRRLAEDVLALVDALGGGRARIVGHDWGAEAVYAAADLAPDRIERLAAIAIPHRATVRFTPALLWAARHFATLRLPGAARRFAADDYAMVDVLCRRWSPTWQFTAEDLEPVKNAFAAPGCLDAALGYYRAVDARTPDFMRATNAVPTLVVTGADDPAVTTEMFERGRAHFTGRYEVTSIPGGHFCHREAPDALVRALVPFLA